MDVQTLASLPSWLPHGDGGVPDWQFYLFVSLAVVVTGIAKAGFGGGIGILAVPLTIVVLDPRKGLGFMLPILIVADLFSYYHHRQNQSRTHLRWLLMGAGVGIVAATVFLYALTHTGDASPVAQVKRINRVLNLVVGGACLLMVAAQGYRLVGGYLPKLPGTPAAGQGTGLVAGFVSTLAHSAGPVVNVYLLEQGLGKGLQTGTAVFFFMIVNVAKVPSFVGLHYITFSPFWESTIKDSLCFMPLIPVGTLLGYWMHQKVAEKPFAVIMYVGAALGAGWMIAKELR